ncbi:patatin-like phospholipase family protein [Bacillus sp. FJAT-44742]|uniref:patatin-like phospholipase family protein n=1 Tax=Bacillus sp. FJAT-44742 TaxID=2014005 RepID=UPI000C234A86|nr:patatin family protein [Bacillus sp. FJAT-44742]
MKDTGLVLEGGGMRGLYTAGALEYFLTHNIHFPYIVGVSAGASMACSYLSRQHGRNKQVNIGLVKDPRFLGFRNLLSERSLFGMNFLFDEIPTKIVPLDFKEIAESDQELVIGTTDCRTGKPYYIKSSQCHDLLNAVRASSSIPLLSPVVNYEGRELVDGGVADPIPIKKAEEAGYKRNIVILTREKGYRKKGSRMQRVTNKLLRKYPNLIETIETRHQLYNRTLDYIDELEETGTIFVLRPSREVSISRTEKSQEKLTALYEAGYSDAKALFSRLPQFNSCLPS